MPGRIVHRGDQLRLVGARLQRDEPLADLGQHDLGRRRESRSRRARPSRSRPHAASTIAARPRSRALAQPRVDVAAEALDVQVGAQTAPSCARPPRARPCRRGRPAGTSASAPCGPHQASRGSARGRHGREREVGGVIGRQVLRRVHGDVDQPAAQGLLELGAEDSRARRARRSCAAGRGRRPSRAARAPTGPSPAARSASAASPAWQSASRDPRVPRREHRLLGVVGETEQVERGLGVLHAVRACRALAQPGGRAVQELADESARQPLERASRSAGSSPAARRSTSAARSASARARSRPIAGTTVRCGLPGAELLGGIGADRLGGRGLARARSATRARDLEREVVEAVHATAARARATSGSTSEGTARSSTTSGGRAAARRRARPCRFAAPRAAPRSS